MDMSTRCLRISNSYYNVGLEKAKIRDLTGAIPNLKKSLQFNKNHTDARNLLGLIYYEMGEVSDALVQWVISMNLNPHDNDADRFLGEVQRKQGRLDTYAQIISKYNQALYYAQNGSDDLASLQLTRVVEANPRYVRAHLLLAVLYMAHDDFVKAGKSLIEVLRIDRNNPQAQYYMSIVKENTGRADIEKKKLKNAFSHRAMQDDDVIIPSTYKESTGWQTMVNIAIGLLIGAAAILFLYVPTIRAQLNSKHNADVAAVSEELSQAHAQENKLDEQIATLTSERDELTTQLNSMDTDEQAKVSQYQRLVGVIDAYRNGDIAAAADLYAGIDATLLTDVNDGSGVSATAIYNSITTTMQTEGYAMLVDKGDAAYETGNYDQAIAFYDKSLVIKPDYIMALYKKGLCYNKLGNTQQANTIFGDLIINYPDTEEAGLAKAERGY